MSDWRYTPPVYGGQSEKDLIGIPEKGRNAGIALREELDRDDTDEILDILNGRGKTAAKTGEGFIEVQGDAENYDFIQLKETGRRFPRPVFTELETSKRKIRSYDESPLDNEFDQFYQGFDQIINDELDDQKFSLENGFEQTVELIADKYGYNMEEKFGDEVKWGAMNTDLDQDPETVLLPDNFQVLGEELASQYWGSSFSTDTYGSYSDLDSEEQVLAETPENVAGIYMFVSGSTADQFGLDYEAIDGAISQLGKFQNQYKNSVKNRS